MIEAEQDRDLRRDIFRTLSKANYPILLMRPMDLSLEDIFLQLTTTEQEVIA